MAQGLIEISFSQLGVASSTLSAPSLAPNCLPDMSRRSPSGDETVQSGL